MFGPQPRSYTFDLPKKVRIGAVRAALATKLQDGAVIVVDASTRRTARRRRPSGLFQRIGATGKTLVIDVTPDEQFTLTARNIDGVRLVAAARVTARDIMDTSCVVATREALEKLQAALL